MSNDETKIQQLKNNLNDFDLRSLNLAGLSPKEELRFHQYIKGICQRLLGDTLNLNEQNIIFALSDKDETNAACVSKGDINIIYITEGLLDLCKNEDQLAFILGHELGHFEERLRQKQHNNSKAEETACDLRAIQKMARGNYNLEEACNIATELFETRSVSIDDLKDPHTNNGSRINLINAMKKKEKDRIIEDKNLEITKSTPLPADIVNMVHNRPKQPPFTESLFSQMQLASDANGSDNDKAKIAVWLKAFHEHIVSDGHSYAMTEDDIKALAVCIDRCFYGNDLFADKFLAAVFADMEALRDDSNFQIYIEIMHNVLDEIYSSDSAYCPSKIDADEKDSKTAAWLRHYLHGFREADGQQYDQIISRLEYVKKFVAEQKFDSYNGIYVKNFNLLELDFNENDVGKKLSPQILKYICSNINAKDKFVTFSGLTAHKMGSALVLTHEKNNWSVFVDASGEIAYSFPAKELANMQTFLMNKIIENAKNSLEAVANDSITDISSRLEILREAYDIISPVSYKNDLKSILEIRNKGEDTKDILYSDVISILSPETKRFFSERTAENSDNLPYTKMITDLYADAIRTAPKEKFNEILETLVYHRAIYRLNGEDKLFRAFLDNPKFNEELSKTIKSYEAFPEKSQGWDWSGLFENSDSATRRLLLNTVQKIQEITDFKLKEHLEHGGNFDDFEQPFKKDLAKLFGFAPEGNIDETTALQNLQKTRNSDMTHITLYEQAYVAYSSYDALKSNADTADELLLGFNAAGTKLSERLYANKQQLKSADTYRIDADEQKQISKQQQLYTNAIDKISQRLLERIDIATENKKFSAHDIHSMTVFNNNFGNNVYGKDGFNTIISNFGFEKSVLHNIETGDYSTITISLLSLSGIMEYYSSTKESDIHKENIYPVLAKVFENQNLNINHKTEIFQTMTEFDIFPSDYKKYYEILIGKDGKSGLLHEIDQSDDSKLKFQSYQKLLNKNARIPDPEIRSDVIKKAAKSYWQSECHEYNDITASQESRNAMIQKISALKESDIAELDKAELLKELSELTISQKELSLAMKPDGIDLQTSDSGAIVAAYGLDVMAYALQQYPETKINIQDFLLGEGSPEEANNLVENIHISLCKEHDKYYSTKVLERYLNGEDILNDLSSSAQKYYNKLNTQSCLHFKKEFDAAPLEVKALIVNEIITTGKADWEESFNIVSSKLFDDAGELSKVGSDFLHSYIAARPNSEKTFYLAAMMAAANNKNKSSENYTNSPYSPEERNLAKGLRLFLENSGPAGTKLAQAMASYNGVPEFIRHEMQFAKSEANPPSRWEIFSGNDETMDKLLRYGPLGKRRGSASFFVTYDLGDKIVKIMRRGAQLKANSEFAIYSDMLHTLSSEYQNISSFKRLVQNAAENVHIETDLQIGEQQYKDAKKLYPETVISNDVTFKLQVMDWVARGQDWAIMDKAQGVDFKELDEPYKTAAAKAVFSTELSNMLSGKRFDSDRHGGQYKFDVQNNVIGIFDTGSMSIVEPTEKERNVLGIVLARTLKGLRHNQNVANVFSAEIDKAADEFYGQEIRHNKSIPPYLSEFQRGMLALSDFYAALSAKDMVKCMISAMDNDKNRVHPQIVKAFKLEIKKSLDNHNISIQNLLDPEKMNNLSPEARANRRIGKILFDTTFKMIGEEQRTDISSDTVQKLVSHLGNSDADLQIVKGVIRGAYAKLNPNNYTQTDRKELGMFLYQVCRIDIKNKKLQKGESIENIISEVAAKSPQIGIYTQNVMKLVSVMAKIPALSDNKLKKAAAFVAFTDHDVAGGFKKALNEDKSVGFVKKMMLNLAPMDFIPHNAKKILIKSVSKRIVANYVSKLLFGSSKLVNIRSNDAHR